VYLKRLAVECGVAECGDVELAAAHQAKDEYCENLQLHWGAPYLLDVA
jgi:hypothetical protein